MKQSRTKQFLLGLFATATVVGATLVPAASASATAPPAGTQQVAQQIINSGRLEAGGEGYAQVQAYANGNMRSHVIGGQTRDCQIDPVILTALKTVTVDRGFTLRISSLNRYCISALTDSGSSSYHWRDGGGHAIDFDKVNGVASNGNTSQDRALIAAMFDALPAPAGLGQLSCGGRNISVPSGWVQFADGCNHNHFEYRGGPIAPPISDFDRSVSIAPDGTLQAKAGMYEPIVTLRTNIVAVDVDGTTTAAVDTAGNVWVQQGAFTNAWVGLVNGAVDVAVDGERFVVLKSDGTVIAKDGLYATWLTQLNGAQKIDASDGRLGVLKNGTLLVKEGNLQAAWVDQGSGMSDFALDGNRVGVVSGPTVFVKEGNLYQPWVSMRNGTRVELEGNRVGVLTPEGVVAVKEGTLYAGWSSLTGPGATDFDMSGTRIGIVNGSVLIKTGALNAAWIGAYATSKVLRLS